MNKDSIIIDDIRSFDTDEYQACVRRWYSEAFSKLEDSGVFVSVMESQRRMGEYGCLKCDGTGFLTMPWPQNYPLVDSGATHDVYIPEMVRCGRCLGQGIYVSRAAAGLTDP